jgi:segregation and condensation protein B
MTAKNLDLAIPLDAMDDDRKTRRGASLLLPFPAKKMSALPSVDSHEKLRILEALLFAAPEPLGEGALAQHFAEGEDLAALLSELQALYAGRGVNLVRVAGKWAFRTSDDLAFLLERQAVEQRRLSRAALETLAIIAYHQPVTRAEIEEIRGVSTSKGTLDVLLETGWIKLRGRRRAPGRPVTYGTTPEFLIHFGFDSIQDLPGLSELKGAGLLDSTLPPGFSMPNPDDAPDLREDEDPLEDEPLGEDEEDPSSDQD